MKVFQLSYKQFVDFRFERIFTRSLFGALLLILFYVIFQVGISAMILFVTSTTTTTLLLWVLFNVLLLECSLLLLWWNATQKLFQLATDSIKSCRFHCFAFFNGWLTVNLKGANRFLGFSYFQPLSMLTGTYLYWWSIVSWKSM